MTQFKAAVFVGANEPLDFRTLTAPDPADGEVVIKLAASGVCHSDLHILKGEWQAPFPMVLGHEGAGVIEAVGSGVTAMKEGDHVILSWIPGCRRCDFCVSGRPVLCTLAGTTAYQHVAADGRPRLRDGDSEVFSYLGIGTFGEYAVVPETAVVKIRKDAPLAQASLVGCAVTTGIGSVINTAMVEPGSTVLVIGCGGVGVNIIQGARLAGAKQIIASDITDDKLDLARVFGATDVVNSREVDLVDVVREMTQGGVDYSFEAIGLASTIEAAYEAIRRGGTAVAVGQVATGVKISIDPFVLSDSEKTLKGSNYGSARQQLDFPKIIDLYLAGKVDLDSMITRRIQLDELNSAFHEMSEGKGIRTVVEYR